MKILYLCPDAGIPVLGGKGAAVHVREMVRAFVRAGHNVTLAAAVLNKLPGEKPAKLNARVLQIRPSAHSTATLATLKEFNQTLGIENALPGELRRILHNKEMSVELLRRFSKARPDFIYERASLYSTAGISLARAWRIPILIELNAPLALEHSTYRAAGFEQLASQAEQWALTRADAVLTVSAELKKHTVALGAKANRVHVFPNGVDATQFKPAPRDEVLQKKLRLSDRPVIGFIGNLRPWHGVQILPRLLEKLVKKLPALRLVIAGDGPLRADLKKEFSKRKLLRHVVFTGALPHGEMPALIRQFDVALAPYSQPDHDFYFSPLKLFEYMACGVPVVCADLGQISKIVHHEKTGLLYSPGDLGELVSACHRLLVDPQLRSRLGQAAARDIHAKFTWDQNAVRAAALVARLCKNYKKQ